MYRLAVCEDEGLTRESLRGLCADILTELGLEHEIAAFESAEELKEAMAAGRDFDLLLLDIVLSAESGMEMARELRRRGDRVSIIFITAYEEYLREGYEVQPVHFLLKPVTRDALSQAIQTDWRLNHSPRTVSLRDRGVTAVLPAAEIRYVESLNRQLVVHMSEGERSFSLSLTQAEQLLPPQFCRCHNSFLVNMEQVREIGRGAITLKDGSAVPLGRQYYKSFQSAFVRYMN